MAAKIPLAPKVPTTLHMITDNYSILFSGTSETNYFELQPNAIPSG
jgi:hypothetical protein